MFAAKEMKKDRKEDGPQRDGSFRPTLGPAQQKTVVEVVKKEKTMASLPGFFRSQMQG